MKLLSIKYILLLLLAVIVVGAAGYKYFEWNSLNALSHKYNAAWKEELRLSETLSNTQNDFLKLLEEEQAPEESTTDLAKKSTDETSTDTHAKLISKSKLLIDQIENYQQTLRKNKSEYEKLARNQKFLVGNKKNFVAELTKYQLAYYDQELERAERTLIVLHFLQNMFALGQEGIILQEFEANAQGSETYYADNIGEVVVFKKYTDEKFKFSNEDEIKKRLPKAYDALEKMKSFYATYYEVAEDYAKGDRESAALKAGKLQEDAVQMNVDPNELIKEETEKELKNTKDSITTLAKQTLLIKNFENKGTPRYPLLPALTGYEEDLVACQLYMYKSGHIYFEVMNEYPNAKKVDDLLTQLNAITPHTNELDKLFDKNALSVSNDDKKISLTCSDKAKKDKYVFETFK